VPRTPAENERIRQAAKDKIHAATIALFVKKGYHATSIDDVAKQAQISKGLLYNYYKGKEELLSEMVQLRIREIEEVMESAAALETPEEQLRHIVEGAIDNVVRRREVYRFYLNLQTQPEDDRILAVHSERLNEAARKQFELQCSMFERLGGEQPRLRSLYFSATLQGTMLMMTTTSKNFPVDGIREQIIREFCVRPEA
jgi:AcrR family transcriptional regulator